MEEKQFIPLQLEDGSTLECEVVGVFPLGKKQYIALIPPDRDGAVEIFHYAESGESYRIDSIETDAEYDRAAAEYERLVNRPI